MTHATSHSHAFWSALRRLSSVDTSGVRLAGVVPPPRELAELRSLVVPATCRVRVLRNFSCEPLLPWLEWLGYQRGVRIESSLADLGQISQELLTPDSPVHSPDLNAVVLGLWLDAIPGLRSTTGGWGWQEVAGQIRQWIEVALEKLPTVLVVNTFLPPFGVPATSRLAREVARLNEWLFDLSAGQPALHVVDVANLAAELGWSQARDARLWELYQAPIRLPLLQRWAAELAQVFAARSGRARKVLVLDCDGTLWGGIVGEEGLEGIQLDPHHPQHAVFTELQRQVLEWHQQGVLIALNSKNNEADVFEVLERHPHCLLRPHHLAAWRVNWSDKAENLLALSEELRIHLDQFTFIDDSPHECERVRSRLPEVDVLQRPADASCDWFTSYNHLRPATVTAADASRSAGYQAERAREATRAQAGDLDSFLESLELVAEIVPATEADLPRLQQLVERTNQFNLTTRRHPPHMLRDLVNSPDALTLALSARDRFGEYGLTAMAVARRRERDFGGGDGVEDGGGRDVLIDTFLMSCRVLGRRLEDALLSELMRGIERTWPGIPVRAEYRPTAKNGQVADFYDRHGFTRVGESSGVVSYCWEARTVLASPRGISIRSWTNSSTNSSTPNSATSVICAQIKSRNEDA